MAIPAKSFKKFISDARKEAKTGHFDKIGRLYEVMAKNNWKLKDVEDLFGTEFVDNAGQPLYELDVADIAHLNFLHDKTCEKWYLKDNEY